MQAPRLYALAFIALARVDGPGVVTFFLRAHGITGLRVDRGEEEIARQFQQRNTQQPVAGPETAAQRDSRFRRGYEAYLRDPRDGSTPDAAALFLRRLWQGELLSPAGTRQLLGLMYAQTIPDRLRAAIPGDVRFADRCGTSYTVDGRTAAFNDIGILTWPDGHTVIVAAFLTDAHAPEARMSDLFKTIAGSIVAHLGPGRPSRRPMR